MTALLAALGAGLAVVTGVRGVHLLRTTGLEGRPEAERPSGAKAPRDLAAVLDRLGGRFTGAAMRAYGPERLRRLERLIRRAGRPDGITPTVYVRRQVAFLILAAGMLVVMSLLGQVLIGVGVAAIFASWMPVWIRSVARARAAAIESDLADFLDVLGVTVGAGMAFRAAIERVCEFYRGPLAEEMMGALHEMSVGVSRREALLALRERNSSDGLASFITALLQAEELGVPLAAALRDIAADARQEHAQQVKQAAAKAGPKVSLVVTGTIVPASGLLIVAALVLANQEALSVFL